MADEVVQSQVLRKALAAFSSRSPNSVVGDLMMLFPEDIVLKMLVCFGGERLTFPKADDVWRAYRRQVIFECLNSRNDKQTRSRLSAHFGISQRAILRTFYEEKSKGKKRKTTGSVSARRAAKIAYKSIHSSMIRDVQEALNLKRRRR